MYVRTWNSAEKGTKNINEAIGQGTFLCGSLYKKNSDIKLKKYSDQCPYDTNGLKSHYYTLPPKLGWPFTGRDGLYLDTIFNSMDVGRILQILINNQGFEDFIACHYIKHGRYAVRSGYHPQWRHHFGPRAIQLALSGSLESSLENSLET
jgi:hypothetical protein